MKLVRAFRDGMTFYGVLEQETIRKIDGCIFEEYRITDETLPLAAVKLLAPVAPPNVLAIGLNYKRHSDEFSRETDRSDFKLPERPVIFIKATSSVVGPEDSISLPKSAPSEVDYEAELAVVIGRSAKDVSEADALDYVLGYTCGNDVSARDCQMKQDTQWARAKSFDTFCPLGPWIETELDPACVRVTSRLNGTVMQDSTTENMIFSVRQLVSYCSRDMTLAPGTVILTGTPEGVGFARKPPVFLKSGDRVEVEIGGIGLLSNTVL